VIGLDTNVIVRLLINDNTRQTEEARRYIKKHCSAAEPGYITHIALVETVWVLERVLKLPKEQVLSAMESLFRIKTITVQDAEIVQQALDCYHAGSIDFADALIGLIGQENGADHTVTFDRAAAKLPGFKLLKA